MSKRPANSDASDDELSPRGPVDCKEVSKPSELTPVTLQCTKLNGASLTVETTSGHTIADVKRKLSLQLELGDEVSLQLLSAGEVLHDDFLVGQLQEHTLQMMMSKVPMLFIPTGLTGASKYRAGGVLAADGSLFFAPCDARRVLCVVPETSKAHCIGPVMGGTDKYEGGGCLGRDGCIYFAPRDAPKVLQIDPQSRSVELVGGTMADPDKYMAGGVVAPNGNIYFAPSCADRVLRIRPGASPAEVEVLEVGPHLAGEWSYAAKGVLAADGRIYFAPANAPHVLCIEAAAEADSERIWEMGRDQPHNPLNDQEAKYVAGGVLGPDGRIYFAPGHAARVLRIDPVQQELSLLGPEHATACAYEADGVLGLDGRIYFAPFFANHVLVIDPQAAAGEEVQTMLRLKSTKRHMGGGAVGPDGCIYFGPGKRPGGKEYVLRIDTSTGVVDLFGNRVGERRRAHQAGFVRGADGRLFSAPYSSDKVLCLQV